MMKKNIFIHAVTMVSFVTTMVASPLLLQVAVAASVTSFSDVLTREKASTAANHLITFTVPAAVAGSETIILTFDNSTSIHASFDYTDVDITDDGVDLVIGAAGPSGTDWGFTRNSGTQITLTNGSAPIAAGSVVTIELGTNATFGATGTHQITNGSAGTTTLTLSGTMGTPDNTGTVAMAIVDDDQVTVTATVAETMTFDLDAASDFSNGESNTPYTVALGTISASSVKVSDTSSVAMIVVEGSTNASGGMAVTVNNVNGSNGLVSTSVSGDNINSSTGTMAIGTENYGLCIATAGLVGWTRNSGTYGADTCALSSGTNGIRGLSATPTAFLNSGGAPLASTAHAEVVVNAEVSSTTPAHSDYTDTLTFIATATF